MINKTQNQEIILISYEELKIKLAQEKVNLIDVREKSEYDEGHLPNSQLLPLSTLTNYQLKNLLTYDNLVIYCRSGKRSRKVAKELINLGKSLVYDLQGGILAWQSAHLPLEI